MPDTPVIRAITLTLPYPPSGLSPNARVHWAKKQRIVRNYRGLCYYTALEQLGIPSTRKPLACPVTAQVTFVVKTRRKRDFDNLLASCKAMWDGLVDAGVLSGDDAGKLHIDGLGIEMGTEPCVRLELVAAA